jgi:tetratricopeptide (TPR) repeat protein
MAGQAPRLLAQRLAAAAIVVLTVLAYLPSLRNGFIWDDDQYVTENKELRSAAGLASIWLTPGAPEHSYHQYYPLVHTTFWIEYHLWQAKAAGYHLVNIALHALVAVLLWRVLTRLEVPGAWVAAAVFALHPLQVESVAWITERKNVLSAVFYLAAALAYLTFAGLDRARPAAAGRWRLYMLAFGLFVCALLSKTVTCTLPAALLLVIWWKRGRLGWRDGALLAPFVVVGAGLGMLTASIEQTSVGAVGADWNLSWADRCLIAARALWFYAGKLAWPASLTFNYPRWTIDARALWQWMFVLGGAVVVVVLWAARRRLGTGPLVAVLFFALTAAPALGFVNVYPMRFSFVADHFQYLASAGLITLAAATGAMASRLASPTGQRTGALATVAVLGLLGIQTWRQQHVYANEETLWRDTLAKNPQAWLAHNNLGMVLVHTDREPEAIGHFEEAIRINPADEKAHCNLGAARLKAARVDEAIEQFERALQIDPGYAEAHNDLGTALVQAGRADEALAHYAEALRLKPRFAEAHYNWALALMRMGRVDDAVGHYEEALRIAPDNAEAHSNLGIALAQSDRLPEAIDQFEQALQLDPQTVGARNNLGYAHYVLGVTRSNQGRFPEAAAQFEQKLQLDPDDALTHYLLGSVHRFMGDIPAAIAEYQESLGLRADQPHALNDLARIRATSDDPQWRDGTEAVRMAERACQLTRRQDAACLDTLAAAYAEAGRFDDAVTTVQQAIVLARSGPASTPAETMERHLELYRAGRALREAVAIDASGSPQR